MHFLLTSQNRKFQARLEIRELEHQMQQLIDEALLESNTVVLAQCSI